MFVLLQALPTVDPEHADVGEEDAEAEDAVLVVRDVDARLDEHKHEEDLAWHLQFLVEVGVPLI